MRKTEQLLSQLDCVDNILFTRLMMEREFQNMLFLLKVESVCQKVSLAESNEQVKNTCSPISSVIR
ncbi:MAG: endonuclease [Lysinibacillus sp.]